MHFFFFLELILKALLSREFNLFLRTSMHRVLHDWRIIDVRFYVSVVEEFSGIDVDDMLQLRKKKQFFWHAFAYVFDLGFPSEFVVDNET